MRTGLGDPSLRRFALIQFLLEVQLWFPVWLLFLTDRGFDLPVIVAADGVFRLTIVGLELPLGRVADRIGRRRSLLVICAGTVVAYTAIAFVSTTAGLFGAWILWGALWAMASGTAAAYLYELVRQQGRLDDRVEIFGRVRAVTSAAVLLSHLAAGVLLALSPPSPFLVTALLGFVALVVSLGLPDVQRTGGAPPRLSVREVGRACVGDRRLRSAIGLASLVLVLGWSVRILYQPLLLELEVPELLTGLSYFGYSAMAVVAGLLVGRLGHVALGRAIGIGLGVLWVGVLGAGLWPELGPWVFVPVMGFGFTAAWTLVEVVVNDQAPDRVRATAFSVVGVVGGIAIAAARPLLGLVADASSVPRAFQIWALVGLVVAPLAILTLRGIRGAAPGRSDVGSPAP